MGLSKSKLNNKPNTPIPLSHCPGLEFLNKAQFPHIIQLEVPRKEGQLALIPPMREHPNHLLKIAPLTTILMLIKLQDELWRGHKTLSKPQTAHS